MASEEPGTSTAALAEEDEATGRGRLVVVSNRLPVTVRTGKGGLEVQASSGGLVSAMEPVLRRQGGTWIGWAGTHATVEASDLEGARPYDLEPVALTESEVQRYYLGLSNRSLWPLFHSLVPTSHFDRRDWETYDTVNRRFAEATALRVREGELVWVHDYHLLRFPTYLRRLRPDVRIAFFLHIPFPPYDVYRILPWARHALRGLLSCDLVGFHTASYARNFAENAEILMGARVDRETGIVEHGDQVLKVGDFPLGIEFETFEARAKKATKRPKGLPERVVLGVDRLDYTKGIPERLQAFERLLELHPTWRERVTLLQLAVPSRSKVAEYRRLKRTVEEEVGRINGRFATATWVPVRYLHRSVSPDRLAGMYRHGDVGLVTALRDGMNLVAKEFVASRVAEPGVLVLSRMAGAAETMSEAVLVNPYDVDQTARALHRALSMGEDERRSRMVALRARERQNDVHAWVNAFLGAAQERSAETRRLRPPDVERWLEPLSDREHLVIMLAYDGTLTRAVRDGASLEPRMRTALEACVAAPHIEVAIVSSRALVDVRERVGLASAIYSGCHGLEVEGPGLPDFHHDDLDHYRARLPEIAEALEGLREDGTDVEIRGASVVLYHDGVSMERQDAVAAAASRVITEHGFVPRPGPFVIEALPPIPWDKGAAALWILRTLHGPDWPLATGVIYAGDDESDEDAFRALSGFGITARVGSALFRTAADRRLPGPEALRPILEGIADRWSDAS